MALGPTHWVCNADLDQPLRFRLVRGEGRTPNPWGFRLDSGRAPEGGLTLPAGISKEGRWGWA